MTHLNDESECKVCQKCSLLQAILLHDEDKFTQSAKVIKQRIQIASDSKKEDSTGADFHTVGNKGVHNFKYVFSAYFVLRSYTCSLYGIFQACMHYESNV